MAFFKLGLHADLVRGVKELGFEQPTPIQSQAIPAVLEGRDVLASSATGSGKTAAFLLPILHRLLQRPCRRTRALIVSPTRELAAQIAEHLAELARYTPLRGAAVYGGVGMGPQRDAMSRGVDVLIATPGRLLDHLRHPYANLAHIETLVLDEADRMLDMGFLPDIRRILQRLPQKRQTLCFSATLPGPIVALTREILTSPVRINVEGQARPAEGITHTVYPVPHLLKSPLLLKLVRGSEIKNALVFARTKRRADRVADYLERHGVQVGCIHGDRSQAQRTQAIQGFKSGRYDVLVATDVAARGLDITALSHVINFDLPACPDDYIHRVGRTARAHLTGDALTFVSPDQEGELRAIERILGSRLARVVLDDFDYAVSNDVPSYGRNGSSGRPTAGSGSAWRPSGARTGEQQTQAPRHGSPASWRRRSSWGSRQRVRAN